LGEFSSDEEEDEDEDDGEEVEIRGEDNEDGTGS
jgi:hypothetical protein